MKIYTKTGDTGETSLFGGQRVKKSHPRVQVYGTLDEANSTLGLVIAYFPERIGGTFGIMKNQLIQIQEELFQVGSELASPKPSASLTLISEVEINRLEAEIDEMEKGLPPLKNFILPGGTPAGAATHLTRTIVRRAERECVDLITLEPIRPEVVRYLNRLSDYLFVAARTINHLQNAPEQQWVPRKK